MSNRGGEVAHSGDAVGAGHLALHLAILPLAPGAVQGNGGLRSEVREEGNLFICEWPHLFAAQTNCPNYLIAFEQWHKQTRSNTCVAHRDPIIILKITFKCCVVRDVGG